jgi:dTDP-glucose pyrophosphorylase
MESFGSDYPKAILPIGNRMLIEYHIEEMSKIGIKKIIVLIGHLGFKIVDAIGSGEKFGVKISYIDQGETLGVAHALGKLEEYVNSPFLLFLGDIFFITESGLGPMIDLMEKSGANVILATKIEHDTNALRRNFAVILDHGTLDVVKKVIEKPRYLVNNIKGCGLYLFDLHIFDAIRRTPRTAMRDEYEITDSIQILIEDGFLVKQLNIIKEDMNLTVPNDLIKCNMRMLKRKGLAKLIGEGVKLNKDARIINSVIGNNVEISSPIKITNSVIFDNVKLDVTGDITNSIVTPEKVVVNCSSGNIGNQK